jgi:uncharacterized SAM-binding protein YcdF (DUF218 family)
MPLVVDPPSPVEKPVSASPVKAKKRGWVKWSGLIFGAACLYVGAEGVATLETKHAKAEGTADVAIVLGASAWKGTPSKVLASRVEESVRLYKAGRVRKVIFTGGSAKGDPSSEAEAARNYAVAQGVAPQDTLVETSSTSTYENLLNAATIYRAQGFKSAFLVSDGLHLHRASAMAADLGLATRPAPCRTLFRSAGVQARFATHELVELLKYRLSAPFLPKG